MKANKKRPLRKWLCDCPKCGRAVTYSEDDLWLCHCECGRALLCTLLGVKSDNTISNHIEAFIKRGVIEVVKNLTTLKIPTNGGELISPKFRGDASVLDINGVPTIRNFRIVQIMIGYENCSICPICIAHCVHRVPCAHHERAKVYEGTTFTRSSATRRRSSTCF